ncbi:MAG: hypothetical protein ACI4TX_04230 [Christensenellales bacterium]
MQEIYILLGEILEISQIIEYNLALLIKYNEYIERLKCDKRIKRSDLFGKDVDKMHNQLLSGTLGQIINKVKEINVFSSESIDKLYKVLNERNNLVHRFFKDNNFSTIERFGQKYNKILQNLDLTLNNMKDINNKLCDIINGQQMEFSNLYKNCKF